MSSFAELRLRSAVLAAVSRMGIVEPTPIQASAIPPLLDGRDLVGQARTGSGKTLAFALPMVERIDPAARGIQALVLVPTRELAIQVGDVINKLAPARGLKLQLLYGGRSLLPEAQALRNGAHIVVGTPGRTLDHLRQKSLSLANVRFLVLDEADEMLDKGFAPDVERIISYTPSERQTALFSATLPAWVANTAAKHLRNPVEAKVDKDQDAPPEIEHVVYDMSPEVKVDALRSFLDKRGEGPIIVFGRTKHGVKKLAKRLADMGYPATALQGNMSQNARERAMASFRSGELPILLATNVAARGIDVSGVDQVINFELPESAELFTHRSGRTGRMGRSGEAITFITPEDYDKWRQIERALGRKLPRQAWSWPHGRPARVVETPKAAEPATRPQSGPRPRPVPVSRVEAAAKSPRAPERSPHPRPSAEGEGKKPRWNRGGYAAGRPARAGERSFNNERTAATASSNVQTRRWSAGSSPSHQATRKSGRVTSSQA